MVARGPPAALPALYVLGSAPIAKAISLCLKISEPFQNLLSGPIGRLGPPASKYVHKHEVTYQ